GHGRERRAEGSRGDRGPGEELASAQVDIILGDDCVIRHPTVSTSFALRALCRLGRTHARFRTLRGAAHYTQTYTPSPRAPRWRRGGFSGVCNAAALGKRVDLRHRIGRRGPRPRLPDRGAAA